MSNPTSLAFSHPSFVLECQGIRESNVLFQTDLVRARGVRGAFVVETRESYYHGETVARCEGTRIFVRKDVSDRDRRLAFDALHALRQLGTI